MDPLALEHADEPIAGGVVATVKGTVEMQRAMERVNEKMYFVVLGHTYNLVGVAKTVQGFEPGFTWSPHWASGGIAHTSLKA